MIGVDTVNWRNRVAVTAAEPGLQQQAAALAQELALPLLTTSQPPSFAYLLTVTDTRLELQAKGVAAPGPVYADFVSGPLAYRRRFGGGRKQPLARAVGLQGGVKPRVLDVTAGLGRDAFVLACLGCTVQLVERSPIVAALLRHGLARASADPVIGALAKKLLSQMRIADGRTFMKTLPETQRPEVVYLDPMYPPRTKTALVKKEMRVLKNIVGEDQDAPALLAAALTCARQRVVVKRPRLAPPLAGPKPDITIAAKTTRFDVYLLR